MTYEEDLHLEATELRLGLPGISRSNDPDQKQQSPSSSSSRGTKRTCSNSESTDIHSSIESNQDHTCCPSPPKVQIVGWPPVRSCRKNINLIKNGNESTEDASGIYVKVSMDGAPYLRKIDLNIYKGYADLLKALGDMFKCNINIIDQYATLTYQDKDGDWMLAGDVPWIMFVSSCKRLRIMRPSESKGLIM